jgi:hypothetical protein
MPKFTVTLTETVTYARQFEAETAEEAEEMARDMWGEASALEQDLLFFVASDGTTATVEKV